MPRLKVMIKMPSLFLLIWWWGSYLGVRLCFRQGFSRKCLLSGSTDTVAMCLHGSTDPVTAALHIVLGDRINVDVVSIHSKDRLERFAMTMLSYGYFGDLMKHSERWAIFGGFNLFTLGFLDSSNNAIVQLGLCFCLKGPKVVNIFLNMKEGDPLTLHIYSKE